MVQESIKYSREIPVQLTCDILVIGGSQSGVAAAICAKRANPDAEVHLIEQFGNLGGQSTNCMVCHWEFREYTNNQGQIIAEGIGKEMIQRIVDKGHSDPLYSAWLRGEGPPFKGMADERGYGDMPLSVEDIKIILKEMCDEAEVKLHFFTKLLDIESDRNEAGNLFPKHAIVTDYYGQYAIQSQIIIDCSANNDVAWKMAGEDAVSIPQFKAMPMQTYAWLGGVDIEKFINGLWEHRAWWQIVYPDDKQQMLQHMREGKSMVIRGGGAFLDMAEDKFEGIFDQLGELCDPIIYYMFKPIRIYPHTVGDTVKYDSVWAIEGPVSFKDQHDGKIISDFQQDQISAVHLMQKMHTVLPGWENCYVARTAQSVGLRQTRVLKGLYQISAADVKTGKQHEDVIGRAAGHDISRFNTEFEYGYDIPYRALVPLKIDGLLVGARSPSCNTEENGLIGLNAHRGIQSTIAVSQAAGVAASLCVKHNINPRDVDIGELQEILRKQDVILTPPK